MQALGFVPTPLPSGQRQPPVLGKKVSSHFAPLPILWILRETSQGLRVPWGTRVCSLDCRAGTRFEFSETSCVTAPGVAPGAKPSPFLVLNAATWGRWSLGSGEAALCSWGISIRVPPTTLSIIGPDLAQQPEHGSQPTRPTYWADLPGPVHLVLACPEPLSSASGRPQHTNPHVLTIPLSPRPQRARDPHLVTAGPAIAHHLLSYCVWSLRICPSSGSWPGPRGA